MGIRHAHVAGGVNDPTKEVSKDRWNEDHEIDDSSIPGVKIVSLSYGKLTDLPASFPPAPHGHDIDDVTGLAGALDARQPLSAVLTATTASFTTALESKLGSIAPGATVNSTDAALRDRSSHTGTQLANTISNFGSSSRGVTLDSFAASATRAAIIATDTVLQALQKVQKWLNDLSALAFSGNAADLAGTKTAAFISDFSEAVDDRVAVLAVAGTNITITYDDVAGTLTFAATGGGGGSPGGSTGKVQWNNGGAFAGAADLEIEGGQMRLPAIATPATPAAGGVKIYGADHQGKTMPAFIGPDGVRNLMRVEAGPNRFWAFDDMTAVVTVGTFVSTVSGSGASNTAQPPYNNKGAGWLLQSLGITATGRAAYGNFTNLIRLDLGASRTGALALILTLSDATNAWTHRVGFNDSSSGDGADGAFFRYTHSVNGGRYQAVTRSNNVETAADTGVTVAANTDYLFEVQVNATGTSALFFINGALVATITTNIPIGAGRETAPSVSAVRSAGTVALSPVSHDFIYVEQYLVGRAA